MAKLLEADMSRIVAAAPVSQVLAAIAGITVVPSHAIDDCKCAMMAHELPLRDHRDLIPSFSDNHLRKAIDVDPGSMFELAESIVANRHRATSSKIAIPTSLLL